MRFDELQERAAEGLGMEESDSVSAGAWTAHLVDQRHSARVQAPEHRVDVLHAQRQMVQGVAPLLEELLQAGIASRSHQLQRSAVGEVEKRRVHFLVWNVLLV